MLLTISNLYPRPDQPTHGLFNLRLFRVLARATPLHNICIVPESKIWNWPAVRCWKDPSAPALPTDYEPIFHVPVLGRNAGWKWFYNGLERWHARWASEGRGKTIDTLLASWLYPDGAAASLLAHKKKIPAWIMVLGSDVYHLRNPIRRRCIIENTRTAAGFICVSQSLANEMIRQGFEPQRIHYIPNGVDGSVYFRRPEKRAEGIVRILFVGNLVKVKDPLLLLESWTRLLDLWEKPGICIHVDIIGDGPEARKMKKAIERHPQKNNVHFHGRQSPAAVAEWMNRSDVLCLTSISEGMPNVILEALNIGLPVVATDVGDCRKMVEGEPYARLVSRGDNRRALVEAMAKALYGLLHETPDRDEMAKRHFGVFTWEKQAQRILELMGLATPR